MAILSGMWVRASTAIMQAGFAVSGGRIRPPASRDGPGRPDLSAGGAQHLSIPAGYRCAECRCCFIMKPAIDVVIRPAWEQEANTWPR